MHTGLNKQKSALQNSGSIPLQSCVFHIPTCVRQPSDTLHSTKPINPSEPVRILTGMTSSAVPNNIIVLSSECSGSFSPQQKWTENIEQLLIRTPTTTGGKREEQAGRERKVFIHGEYSVSNYEIMQDRWEHNLTESIINPRKASFPCISWNITRHLCPELSSSDTLVLGISELYFYFNLNCSSMEINSKECKRKINWRNTELIFQSVSCWNTTFVFVATKVDTIGSELWV